MNANRPSWLISSVGWLNLLIGLAFVAFGVYVLFDGANAVATLFALKSDVGKAADQVPGLQADDAKKVAGAADLFAKGLAGVILALVGVVAGCAIVQGLPHLLLGLGVLMRSNVARIFAILFAILALLQGIACLAGSGQSMRFLYIGLFLLFYAVLTFVALIGKRASFEFSGGLRQAAAPGVETSSGENMPAQSSTHQPSSPAVVVVLAVLLVVATGTAAVFATLYFTSRSQATAQPPEARNGKPTAIDDTQAMEKRQPRLAEFHKAVLAGQIPRAAELLKDVDVDEPDEEGRTALMKAGAKGNIRMTMFLLAMGAQLNQKDKEGGTPLMHAAENGQTGVINLFFDQKNAPEEIGMLRAQYQPVAGLKLDAKGATLPAFKMPAPEYNDRDNQGRSALMRAMLKGQLDAARRLTDNFADAGLTDANGNTIVHLLAAKGIVVVIRALSVERLTGGTTAYWNFGFQKRAGTEFQTNQAGQTAWMLAAEKGHLDIVKHLLVNPTLDELQRKDHAGKTGLDLATANNHKDVAAYLSALRDELMKKTEKPK